MDDVGCELYLMRRKHIFSPIKVSDKNNLYIYKENEGKIYYKIHGNNKKQYLDNIIEIKKSLDHLKFEQPIKNPMKCMIENVCIIIIKETFKRGHTCYLDNGYRVAEVDEHSNINLISTILMQIIKDCVMYQSPPNPFFVRRKNGKKPLIDESSRAYIAWAAREYLKQKNSWFKYYCQLLDIDINVFCEKAEKTIIYFDLGLINEFTNKINSLYKSNEILYFYVIYLLQLIENCVEKTECME